MAKLTKKQKLIAEKFDSEKFYAIPDALEILSSVSSTKFKEALDVSVNLGVDPRKSDQVVRGATTLPHGTCLLYTSPSPRDLSTSRMPSSA